MTPTRSRSTRTIARLVWGAACATTLAAPRGAAAQDAGTAALGELLDGLGTSARVLVIGAHPDDEDTPLIALLSRGRHVRTAYLSLTRGEGGANLIGGESGEVLGVVRTAESLAARRVDGAEQYFTRAYDFGISKSAAETFARWGKIEGPDAVTSDVVTIIRTFRPHVIVSVHEGTARDGHGNHEAAGRIARAAFAGAADSTRFQGYGRPWRATALYRVARPDERDSANVVRLNVGEYSPRLGRTYAEVAAESRARQRTQGGAAPGALGASWDALKLLAGPAVEGGERTFFDGVDTTLARLRRPGLDPRLVATMDSLPAAIAAARAAYRPDDPSSVVPTLAALTALASRAAALAGVTATGVVYDADAARSLEDLWRRAHDALVIASGIAVEATADRETVARATPSDSSDTLRVNVAVYDRGRVPVRVGLAFMTGGPNIRLVPNAMVAPDSAWRGTLAATPRFLTQAWWRGAGRLGDLYAFNVDGRTEREWQESNEAGALRVTVRVNVAGTDVTLGVPVTYRPSEPSRLAERPVAVVPGLTLRLDHGAEYARAGLPLARPMRVTLQSSYTTPREVRVTMRAAEGLRVDSAERTITMPPGVTGVVTYVVRGTPPASLLGVDALAMVGGDTLYSGSATLTYDHIPPQRLYFPAGTMIQAVPVAMPPRLSVAYVASQNDGVPLMLSELGVQVTNVDPAQLTLPALDLSRFTAIVLGARAYETSPALLGANDKLLAFARAGGTVVVQGGQYLMEQPGVLPYPLTIGRPPMLVTQEESPVRLVDPASPLLTVPNRIVDRDFAGWVQERASFVPAAFDPRWRAPLAVADAGEEPSRGALLVAPVGRGAFVYTTLAFNRQLPAANPGAARLFVNLLAARGPGATPSASHAR